MTAGPNGTPENDDPFAYLYRGEGEQGAGQGTAGQPGVPRTSYNQVSRVGERRPSAPGGYGYPPQAPQPQPGGQGPAAPGGRAASRQAAGAAQGGGPNRKGLLIGAIAVVAAVVVGISVAALSSGDDEDKQADDPAATAPADPGGEDPDNKAADGDDKGKDKKDAKKFKTLTAFANSLRLDGGATASTEHAGASGPNGAYVDHMNVVGASATWTFDVPEAGPYTFYIGYGNAGETATPTLTVNGTAQDRKINMGNFTGQKEWSKAWTETYSWVNLNKGTNTLKISCEDGDKCGFNLDKVWLKQGHIEK
ncbi:hypothetical protein ACFW9F_28650 [Streptomyces sp. NPDC059506]|uniref:hypothetical protein n=1 Tax=Streptomyces sp. NPDC059506 TaxID=3347751 RepID=UPI0036A702D1